MRTTILMWVMIASLVGCAAPHKVVAPPPPPPDPAPAPVPELRGVDYRGQDITVWYGTNRQPGDLSSMEKPYGNQRDSRLNYGKCLVHIPKNHKRGSLGSSLPWKDDDPIAYKATFSLTEQVFWKELQAALAGIEQNERRVMVFVHGYKNSFVDAARRTAQIWADLGVKGVPAFFNWPSRGGVLQYTVDEASIEASEGYLAEFLIGMLNRLDADDVHVIAHSMGNRALLRVVNNATEMARIKTGKKFSQIILAAPDLDLDVFNRLAAAYKRVAERTTLYISEKDRAVLLSHALHASPRVGAPPPVAIVEHVDTVEVRTPHQGVLDIGHSYFAEHGPMLDDIQSLLTRKGPDLSQRTPVSEYLPVYRQWWVIDAKR